MNVRQELTTVVHLPNVQTLSAVSLVRAKKDSQEMELPAKVSFTI